MAYAIAEAEEGSMTLGPVVVGIEGPHELTAADRERLVHPLVGMVILFRAQLRNIRTNCSG